MMKKEDPTGGNDPGEIACLGKRGSERLRMLYLRQSTEGLKMISFSRFSAGRSARVEEVSGSKKKIKLRRSNYKSKDNLAMFNSMCLCYYIHDTHTCLGRAFPHNATQLTLVTLSSIQKPSSFLPHWPCHLGWIAPLPFSPCDLELSYMILPQSPYLRPLFVSFTCLPQFADVISHFWSLLPVHKATYVQRAFLSLHILYRISPRNIKFLSQSQCSIDLEWTFILTRGWLSCCNKEA